MARPRTKTLGERLIEAAEEALRFTRGEDIGARVWEIELPDPKKIRRKLGLSQEEFAQRFYLSPGTLRNWEQGVRAPEGPALVLLRVIEHEPEAVVRALRATKPKLVHPDRARPAKYRAKAKAKAKSKPKSRAAPARARAGKRPLKLP